MLNCCRSFLDTGIGAIGRLELLSTEVGLVAVLFCDERRSDASAAWRQRNVESVFPSLSGEHDHYADQLWEYLAGGRQEFTIPLHRTGTTFQCAVLDAVAKVPYGTRASYQDIARAVGNSAACRAVGAANGANPLPLIIPCHRIVGTSAKLTGYGGGLDAKRWLLSLESSALLALAS